MRILLLGATGRTGKWVLKLAIAQGYKVNCLSRNTSLDWTTIRPAGLTDFGKDRSIKVSCNNIPKPSLLIARKSEATFIINVIEKNEFINGVVVISNR